MNILEMLAKIHSDVADAGDLFGEDEKRMAYQHLSSALRRLELLHSVLNAPGDVVVESGTLKPLRERPRHG